jgi:hypothetical protein
MMNRLQILLSKSNCAATQRASNDNTGAATVDTPAAVGLTCPPAKSAAGAMVLIESEAGAYTRSLFSST